MTYRPTLMLTLLAVPLLALTGCANFKPPQAWEKGNLAQPAMSMASDPLEERFNQHTYSSKENASGGYGVGGGGCGCN
jgi:Domain of unknown function (DUF4266)